MNVEAFSAVVGSLALLGAVIAIWRMERIGEKLEGHFDENLSKSVDATLEAIRANGEETLRAIAAAHQSVKDELKGE